MANKTFSYNVLINSQSEETRLNSQSEETRHPFAERTPPSSPATRMPPKEKKNMGMPGPFKRSKIELVLKTNVFWYKFTY